MDVRNVALTVVGALIAYILATTLITSLVTGTTTGDTLIQNIVPIVAAAGAVIIILGVFLK